MSYTPISTTAFTSAYSGAISGMAVSGWITNPSPASYLLLTQIAGAFAQAFDQAWNSSAPLNLLEESSIVSVCQTEFIGRGPGPIDNLQFQQVSNWTVPAAACAALVLEGDTYFISQGVLLPPVIPTNPAFFVQVANSAALTALNNAAFPNGSIAYMPTYNGTYWSLEPTTALIPDEIIAAHDGRVWTRTLQANTEAALAQAPWFIDPAAGNDEATGLTSGAAVKHYAEIVRRWGTPDPVITDAVTITWVTDGDPSADPVIGSPQTQGPLAALLYQGTVTNVGPPLTLTTFTQKNLGTGALARIAVAGHGAWTPGTLLHDITAGCSFYVVADLGGGSATITEPVDIVGLARAVPANGDTLQVVARTKIPVTRLTASSDFAGAGTTIQQAIVVSDAASIMEAVNLIECSTASDGSSSWVCTANQFLECFLFGCFVGDGGNNAGLLGTVAVAAGALTGVGNNLDDGSHLFLDVVIPLRCHPTGNLAIASAYFGQWPETDINNAAVSYTIGNTFPFDATGRVWGPATIDPVLGQQMQLFSVTAVAALLCTGGVTIDSQGTAWPWIPGSNAYGAAVTTTPAHIDNPGVGASPGLSNPASGTRIFHL